MASPTPTSDPVTASPTPPVSDPIVASDRPDKPIMGNIVSLSRDDWSAWTGGKPAPGWVGLDPSAADDITSPNQLRPVHASASQKVQLSSYRHDDLFTQASSLRLPERRLGPSRRLWDGYHRLSPRSRKLLRDDERRQEPLATPSRQQRLSAPSRFFVTTSMTSRTTSPPPSSFFVSRSRSHEQDQRENGRRRLVSRRLASADQDDPVDVDRAL
ncbi:hypothetical protein MHU86_25513 [Fragilaria crotonensis]|nr:hypothetical protein MHU86_25513 [Fragilaria crotonensis]